MKLISKEDYPFLKTTYEGSMVRLAHRILNDRSLILFSEFDRLPLGRLYRAYKCKTNCLKLSFIGTSITLPQKTKHLATAMYLNNPCTLSCTFYNLVLMFLFHFLFFIFIGYIFLVFYHIKCFQGRCNIQQTFNLHSGSNMISPSVLFFLCCCTM